MNIELLLTGFDPSNIPVSTSIAPLLIGALIAGAVSLIVGVYTFLQMRKMQKKNRPKPNQLDGTIADEGISFHDIAGSPHVHANITDIWGKSTQAIKKKSGGFLGIGKTSQVTGYRYYARFAAFIGNRIEKLIAINFDNRKWVLHDPTKHPVNMLPVREGNLFGENEGGVSGNVDIHFGYPDPEPNAEYQKYFSLASGYPYQSYLVFRSLTGGAPSLGEGLSPAGFYLGNSGYMKEMLLWVKRTRVRNDGREQWYKVRGDGAVVCEIGAYKKNQTEEVGEHEINVTEIVKNKTNHGYQADDIIQTGSVLVSNNYIGSLAFSLVGMSYFGGNNDEKEVISGFNLKFDENIFIEGYFIFSVLGGFDLSVYGVSSDISEIKEYVFDNMPRKDVTVKFYGKTSEIGIDIIAKSIAVSDTSSAWLSCSDFFYKITPMSGMVELDGLDINPIHKIREILTDDTAMGKPESDVNDANFRKAANSIWDESLGVSWAVDEKSCIEAIEELCYHIEAGIRVNRQTGLYEMVLFRDDWFEESEIHAISENKIKDLSLEVMNSDDIVNQLNVTYYDRQRIKNSTFSVYENGSILTMGHANAESVEFPYFMHMRNAEIVANWKLKQFSTPAWSGSFTTGWREARKWNRYDLIRLPWSKKWNGTILVRIMKINLGNGTDNTVTIDFEEVIPYSGEMNTSIAVDESMNEGVIPPQPSENEIFEAPYYLTVLRAGQTNTDLELSNNPDIGYVAAIAAKPQSNSLNALLYTDGGMGEFEQASRLDYCDILQLDQSIIETTSSFMVTGSLTQTANSNNFILLNGELMGFVSFSDATKVLTVKRGVLDTVPKKHSSGSLFIFDLPDVAFDSTQYAQSEIVEAQVLTTTPSGIQGLSAAGVPVEIQARAIRPYPPANVKINGEYWPVEIETDLIITWVDRNRVQQTGGVPLSWFDNGIAIESNTQTYLTVTELNVSDQVLATSNNNVTGMSSYILAISAMQPDTAKVSIEIKTIRDSYESYQSFNHIVVIMRPFSAPYDITYALREV